MSARKNSLLLLLVLALGLGGAGAWVWSGRHSGSGEPPPLEITGPRIAPNAPVADPQAAVEEPLPLDLTVRTAEGAVGTTVAFPLELELTQLQRGTFSSDEGIAAPGSGANARLKGRLTGDRGAGVMGHIEFTAGPNVGRVLRTDGDGNFGASDLYQGMAIVEIQADTGVRSVRQIVLRQLSTSELFVALGREAACTVRGLVKDKTGAPIFGAEVVLDGNRTSTDDQGEFYFPRISPDKVVAVVRKRGYASYMEIVAATRGGVISRENLVFTLYGGADLELRLDQAIGSAGPALAYVFPVGGQRVNSSLGQNTFPWHEINPVELYPGGTALVEGLQPGHVILTVFHPGAQASPPFETKKLLEGKVNHHAFRLREAETLRGVVKGADGRPIARADVTLEAPDRGDATMKVMQQKPTFNLDMIVPQLPSALQTVKTDARGAFALTLFPQISSRYYLTAVDPSGRMRANRVVTAEAAEIELQLEPAADETGQVRVRMGGRFQGLPVKVTVNGTPMEPYVLPAGDDLVVEGLEAGTWRAEVWWHHDQLERGKSFELRPDGSAELSVVLPLPALEGEPTPDPGR